MAQAMTKHEIETIVREVTDEEVAFYHEYGWVMMPRLVAPDFATELLRVGKSHRQKVGPGKPVAGLARNQETEPFRSFMFSERMAQNATRLVNRKRFKGVDVPLRYRVDILLNKPPGAAGSTYHQDSSEHGSDRVGELQFWLALAEVTPEMGAMRFVSRSHREGPLGSVFNDDRGDLLKQFPNLTSVLGAVAALPLPAGRLHRTSRIHRPRRPRQHHRQATLVLPLLVQSLGHPLLERQRRQLGQ